MKINILLCTIIIYKINGIALEPDIQTNRNKPYENKDLFEGDIVLPRTRGVLLRGDTVAWTNGIVPYEIAPGYAPESEQYIIATMEKMERIIAIDNIKCVQFRLRTPSDPYYITIRNGDGCSSYVGQNTGVNMERTVTLQEDGCLDDGRVMHELIHALGFFHEQSRPDRDDYVRINYENIVPGMEYNFEKYNNSYVDTLNTSYDYASVMHYKKDAFSANGLPTIEPLQPNVTIGQLVGMSVIDIQEIRIFYNCSSTGVTFPPMPTTITANFNGVNTTASSNLTANTQTYSRDCTLNRHYYEAFELTVPSYGYYGIFSSSSLDTFGYLYQQAFYPYAPNSNLITSNDDVFTTYEPLTTGDYTLTVSGSVEVNLTKIDTGSTTLSPNATTPNNLISIYSSALTINSPIFNRQKNIYDNFYYEPISITVSIDGYYTFTDNSTVDSYGYLYLNNFNPCNVVQGLLAQDDDNGGNLQFSIAYHLQTSNKYILVQTTHYPYTFTSFTIEALGPGSVSFSRDNSASTTVQPTASTCQSSGRK